MIIDKEIMCPICGSRRTVSKCPNKDINICKDCDVLFRHPFPSEQSLESIYEKNYSIENITKKIMNVETDVLIARQLFDLIMKEVSEKIRNVNMLEFGAGLGNFCEVVKDKVKNIVAVEKNKNAREFISQKEIEVISSLGEIYGKAEFDLIVMIEVIEHLKDPVGILKRFYQLLKPDGKLFITTPNHRGLNSLITKERWREISRPTHLYAFSPKSLYRTLSIAGFNKIKWLKKPVNFKRRDNFSIQIFISHLLQYTNLSGGLKYIATK